MNQKKIVVVLAISILSFLGTRPARAMTSRVGSSQDLGIGFGLGQPFGTTAKYWLSSTTAVDASAGFHFNKNFDMQMNYLWHSFSSFNVSSGRMPFYIGLGGRVLLGNDSQLGLRSPIGVSYLLPSDPIEIFAEIAPVIKVIKGVGLDMDGRVGIRFYINYFK